MGFLNHRDYLDCLNYFEALACRHSLHELVLEHQPRCLYFDLDGVPEHKDLHENIISWLQSFVRWFFSGDSLNWAPEYPEPVVLRSSSPEKFSCHVVFPQIQFRDFAHQSDYLPFLLEALGALQVDLED